MEADPSGIGNDRAMVHAIDDDRVQLAVGPGRTPMYVTEDDLPEGAEVGTWLVLDMQMSPPMVLWIDEELTAAGVRID